MCSGCKASDVTHKLQVTCSLLHVSMAYFCISFIVALVEPLGLREKCFF